MGLLQRTTDRVRAASGSLKLLFGAGLPLGALTRVLAARFGDRPALVADAPSPGFPRRVRSYRRLDADVARMAAAFAHAGFGEGRTVAVICANRADVLLYILALARAGAVPLPLNHRMRSEEQLAVMQLAGANELVADADGGAALVPHLRDARVVWTGAGGPPPGPGLVLPEWLRAHRGVRLETPRGDPQPALLLATSGTTGRPKLARITSRGLLGAVGRLHALPVGNQRGLRAGRDAVLVSLPLTHVMGLATMLGALCSGVKVIHLDRFEAPRVLDRIEADAPNVFVGVPTMYADLEAAGAAERNLTSVELWCSAADVMPPDRARRFQGYGALERVRNRPLGTAVFADIYGMVELAGPAAVRLYPPAPRGRELPAIGFVLPGFSARVVDPSGHALRLGLAGELQLRGPGLFGGYVGGEAPSESGWFPTGDLARLGPGGTFAFVGRTRDRLKVGGFSVFPAEVETELQGHPLVAELAVVGVPDARLGEVPAAVVVARPGFDPEAFVTWAAERVATGYRRPRATFVVDALPRGGNNKVDRKAATELAVRALKARG